MNNVRGHLLGFSDQGLVISDQGAPTCFPTHAIPAIHLVVGGRDASTCFPTTVIRITV